jgi:hypothetical protein
MRLLEEIRPKLLEEISTLCLKHNLSLFQKIRKEEVMLHLKSLLTEAHFGIYFDSIGSKLKYNSRVFKENEVTPDFAFTKNSQEIIAEVCRVNPAEKDMEVQAAEDHAIEEFKRKHPGVPVMGGTHSITWKPDKLSGKNASLSVKANKYGPPAEQADNPIILCIYLDFISGLNKLDLNHSLYGNPADFVGEFAFDGYFPGSKFHVLSDGLFYNNEQMKKNISGVLLRDNDGSHIYYHNFSATNRLNKENIEFFLTMQHPYE